MHNIFALSAWRVKIYLMLSRLLMTPCAMRNTPGMGEGNRRERLEQAGNWLRAQRVARGFKTAGELARALSVDPSRISSYERGMSEVPRERAQQIADLFEMDIIEVRRNLGLWVPADPPAAPTGEETEDLGITLRDETERYLAQTPGLTADQRVSVIMIVRSVRDPSWARGLPREAGEQREEHRRGA